MAPQGRFKRFVANDTSTVDTSDFRIKRSAERIAQPIENLCRLVKHEVDFNEFGADWNHFIAPRKFDVKKAKGRCLPFMQGQGLRIKHEQ